MKSIAILTPADLRALPDDQLLAELHGLVQTTAEHVARLANVWLELERRGHDLSKLRVGIGRYLSSVALKRLSPRAVVQLAGNATAIRALSHLSLSEQDRLIDVGEIRVRRGEEIETVPLQSITAADVARAFDPVGGTLLTPEQQSQPRKIKSRPRPPRRVIIELTVEQHDKLQAEAARTNRSAAALVIQCLINEDAI